MKTLGDEFDDKLIKILKDIDDTDRPALADTKEHPVEKPPDTIPIPEGEEPEHEGHGHGYIPPGGGQNAPPPVAPIPPAEETEEEATRKDDRAARKAENEADRAARKAERKK